MKAHKSKAHEPTQQQHRGRRKHILSGYSNCRGVDLLLTPLHTSHKRFRCRPSFGELLFFVQVSKRRSAIFYFVYASVGRRISCLQHGHSRRSRIVAKDQCIKRLLLCEIIYGDVKRTPSDRPKRAMDRVFQTLRLPVSVSGRAMLAHTERHPIPQLT